MYSSRESCFSLSGTHEQYEWYVVSTVERLERPFTSHGFVVGRGAVAVVGAVLLLVVVVIVVVTVVVVVVIIIVVIVIIVIIIIIIIIVIVIIIIVVVVIVRIVVIFIFILILVSKVLIPTGTRPATRDAVNADNPTPSQLLILPSAHPLPLDPNTFRHQRQGCTRAYSPSSSSLMSPSSSTLPWLDSVDDVDADRTTTRRSCENKCSPLLLSSCPRLLPQQFAQRLQPLHPRPVLMARPTTTNEHEQRQFQRRATPRMPTPTTAQQ